MQQLSGKKRWQQLEVQDNGLASSNDLHGIEVDWYENKLYFWWFHILKCKGLSVLFMTCNLLTIALQIRLASFRATPEWLHILSLRFYFTCNFKEQSIPFAPIFRHIRTRCAFVDTFEFATNKAFDVCIGMSMLFWLGSVLKSGR